MKQHHFHTHHSAETGRPQHPGHHPGHYPGHRRGHHPSPHGEPENQPGPDSRHGGPGRGGRHHHGERRGRARRGESRYLLLDALRNAPMHGYEVIKSLETRADGRYAPSPGVVYPTLQMLEDLGLVRSSEVNGKRVFELTDEGLQELNAHAEEVAAFWRQFAPATSPGRAEVRFVADELGYLGDTVWSVLNGVDSVDTIREVRQALEACRNQIRALVTGNVTDPQE